MKGVYKKGTLLEEYFLNPHFRPTKKERKELDSIFENRHYLKRTFSLKKENKS